MLKTLLKKQMSEIFRSYIYNQKTNTLRSKSSQIGYIVLFVAVMVIFIGGMFGSLAFLMCASLVESGMTWMYFSIFSILALMLGIFGSVFNTYSGLYLSKDNDFILSMPIPVSAIMFSRLLSVYLMGLMYSGVVIIPAVAVYFITSGASAASVMGCLALIIVLSLIDLVLSCALGWVVAKISLKLKNKAIVTVIISLAFIGVYYFACFNAQTVINSILENAENYGERLRGFAYPIYLLGRVGEGSIWAILLAIGFTALLVFVTWKILSSSFIEIATSSSKSLVAVKRKRRGNKQHGQFLCLIIKEFERLKSSPTYLLNCALATLILPISAVLILIKGAQISSTIETVLSGYDGVLSVILCFCICLLMTMNDSIAPSVSLEGKTIWQVRSLPVSTKQILLAKLALQFIMTAIPALLCSISAIIAFKFSFFQSIAVLVIPLVFEAMYDCFGLLAGLRNPNLNWTSEIAPIKQNMSVLLVLVFGWAYPVIMIGLYFALGSFMKTEIYLFLSLVLTALLTAMLYRKIINKGIRTFESL